MLLLLFRVFVRFDRNRLVYCELLSQYSWRRSMKRRKKRLWIGIVLDKEFKLVIKRMQKSGETLVVCSWVLCAPRLKSCGNFREIVTTHPRCVAVNARYIFTNISFPLFLSLALSSVNPFVWCYTIDMMSWWFLNGTCATLAQLHGITHHRLIVCFYGNGRVECTSSKSSKIEKYRRNERTARTTKI